MILIKGAIELLGIAVFIIITLGGFCLAWWIGESVVRGVMGKDQEPFLSI